ncbi:DNA/RNA non-specific endonuclease [Candidatus Halobeggiatoa sp. HSG11]|nr:DNA/RNA non-specific endonuclease [Candidatus Halobeggiatoa sp. HSG11]
MNLTYIIIGVGGFIAGAIAMYVFLIYLWPNRHKTYNWIYKFRNHKKLGEPCKTDLVLNRDGYCLGYSFNHKCAAWVSYTISKGSIGVDVERDDCFYDDLDIPEKHRVQPNDFKNTGYDKGHLAPSASIDFSRKSNAQTFAMSNIALQHPRLNRQAWGSLENTIRNWTDNRGKLMIVAGPIYARRPKTINNIPIPKAFYKIIYSFKYKRCIGFIFPNEAIRASKLWDHVMSVDNVEKETGQKFLTELNDKKIKGELDVAWWKASKI